MLSINRYRLPIPKDQLKRIDRTSSPAHLGKLRNAIDFIVDEQTPVLAAADGIVYFVKDDSDIGGSIPIYWNYSNFIVIMHSNGEYSRYDHLSYSSSMTGFTYVPHLHFQVFVVTGINLWADFDTLEVQDLDISTNCP